VLTDEEGSYFRDMESLFSHPGWVRLIQELNTSIDGMDADAFWTVRSFDQLMVLRAKLEERKRLRDYPQIIERLKEDTIAHRVNMLREMGDAEGSLQ